MGGREGHSMVLDSMYGGLLVLVTGSPETESFNPRTPRIPTLQYVLHCSVGRRQVEDPG